jgi:hypothetical protein
VVPIQPPPASTRLLFPHFANGGGISSSIFLLNGSDNTSRGTLRFTGDTGLPLSVSVDGMSSAPDAEFSISPNGGAVMTTSGDGPLTIGWVSAVSDTPIGGTLRFTLPGLGITGIGAAASVNGFIMPVARSVESGFSTGVAVISTETSVNLALTLRDAGGSIVTNGFEQRTLPAGGHIAQFVHELFPNADTREFEGTLTATSESGPIAGIALQLGARPGEFTTLPATPLP